jgi:hypothetical protein
MVVAGVLSLATGLIGLVLATGHWAASGFLPVDDPEGMRVVVPSLVAMGVGLQLVLSGFLYGLLDMTRIEKRN